MTELEQFYNERSCRVESYSTNTELNQLANEWIRRSMQENYVYNFDWLGRPIIQYPEDIVGIQELVWEMKPDTIIETGVAHGGSLILSASLLALLDLCDSIEKGKIYNPKKSKRRVIGIDIDIRKHNRELIEQHAMSNYISLIEGSSIDRDVVSRVEELTKSSNSTCVFLDSNHTHDHVLSELRAYSQFVSVDNYCVVFDTFVELMPEQFFPTRPWDVGNNPMTAIRSFIDENTSFVVDEYISEKLQITVAKNGFLKRVK